MNYKDVQETQLINGAMYSSARTNFVIIPNIDYNPLRDSIYFVQNGAIGHVVVNLHGEIIINFLQSYLINKIRFWMYDFDNRVTYMQDFATEKDGITETLIYQGSAQPGVQLRNCFFQFFFQLLLYQKFILPINMSVVTAKFKELQVQKLRFYNKDGNSLAEHMSIIKIQAYYGF